LEGFHGFLKAAPDAFVLFDSDMNFVQLNDAALEHYTHGEKKDILGRHITDIVPGIENTVRYGKYLDVIKTGISCSIEDVTSEDVTSDPASGNKHIDVKAFKVGDGLGVIIRDITHRKITEKELKESEAGARTLMNASPSFAALMDLDGNIVSINDAGADIFGKKREDLIGSKASDLLPPEFSNLNESRLARGKKVFDTGKPIRFQDIQQGRFIDHSIYPVLNDYGDVAQIAIFSEDITDLIKTQKALQFSENNYRVLVESSPDVICSINGEGAITFINDTVRRFGYHPKKLIGKHIDKLIHPLDRHILMDHLNTDDNQTVWQDEIRICSKNGETYHTLVKSHTIDNKMSSDSGEQVSDAIYIFRDVTEYWEMMKEKNKLQKRLVEAEKMATMGQFTSSIAHELNNSLDILLTKLYLLQKTLPEQNRESLLLKYIDPMREQIVRMSHFSKDILNYVKPRSFIMESVSLNQLLSQVVEFFTDRVSISAFLNVHIEPDLPLIKGNATGLEIVFRNIIKNSFESLKDVGEITISATQLNEEECEVVISDTGRGIAKKNITKIFDPFFSTKKRSGGTGLGLSICKEIIDSHNGSIQVESRWNKGTSIIIRLPILHS
jgi:two-component system sporulation sensor kinase A